MLNIRNRSLHRRKNDPWRSDRSWWRPTRLAARPVQIFHSQVLGGKFQVSCQRLGKLGVLILFLRSKKRNTFYHELLTATFHPCIHMRMDTHNILVYKYNYKYIYIYILCVLHNLGMISKVIYRSSLWYCLICFLICFILSQAIFYHKHISIAFRPEKVTGAHGLCHQSPVPSAYLQPWRPARNGMHMKPCQLEHVRSITLTVVHGLCLFSLPTFKWFLFKRYADLESNISSR